MVSWEINAGGETSTANLYDILMIKLDHNLKKNPPFKHNNKQFSHFINVACCSCPLLVSDYK